MAFTERWHTLLDACDELPAEVTFITPLTSKRFRITEAQEHRVLVEFDPTDAEGAHTQPLQCKQFETLAERISNATDGFDL